MLPRIALDAKRSSVSLVGLWGRLHPSRTGFILAVAGDLQAASPSQENRLSLAGYVTGFGDCGLLPEKQGQTALSRSGFAGGRGVWKGQRSLSRLFLREDCARIAETFLKEEPG